MLKESWGKEPLVEIRGEDGKARDAKELEDEEDGWEEEEEEETEDKKRVNNG